MPVTYYGSEPLTKELFNKELVDSPPAAVAVDVETISLK